MVEYVYSYFFKIREQFYLDPPDPYRIRIRIQQFR
jgi:hypothetical protein